MSSSSPFSSRNVTRSLHSIPHHQVHHQHPSSLTCPVPKPSSFRLFPNSHHHLRVLSASPGSPNYSLEESRWLREEQWRLCEEQRRFHEEQRWACEKEFLLGEIDRLKLRIQALEWEIQILGGDHGGGGERCRTVAREEFDRGERVEHESDAAGGERGGGDGREGDCSGEELLRYRKIKLFGSIRIMNRIFRGWAQKEIFWFGSNTPNSEGLACSREYSEGGASRKEKEAIERVIH